MAAPTVAAKALALGQLYAFPSPTTPALKRGCGAEIGLALLVLSWIATVSWEEKKQGSGPFLPSASCGFCPDQSQREQHPSFHLFRRSHSNMCRVPFRNVSCRHTVEVLHVHCKHITATIITKPGLAKKKEVEFLVA